MSRTRDKAQRAVRVSVYRACIQPFHGHKRIVASGRDNDPHAWVQDGGRPLTYEVADFHSTPIHALTTTVANPMSGIPMNTSPKMNNVSLTSMFP